MATIDTPLTGDTMPATGSSFSRHDISMALHVTRREVKDSFRDWRIIIPIVLLTLFFPGLMNFTAERLLNYVGQFGAELIAERLIPFLLLVVGFFPMSFSLVIALETFVGEKERKSLEPLLATPLTDTQLYMGKVLAAIVPPLSAAYLGIAVYLVGLWITVDWTPPLELLLQAVLITTIQGVVMVSGAVVISSQTTSVRASNLLASFIIVPMALLIQGEAVLLFFANYRGLWWIIIAMLVVAVVLVRMGIKLFNREELLGRSIDHISLMPLLRRFVNHFLGRDEAGALPGVRGWYRETFTLIPQLRKAILAMVILVLLAIAIGQWMGQVYALPPELQAQLDSSAWQQNIEMLPVYSTRLPIIIMLQNIRVVGIQVLTGIFTLGVLGAMIFMVPWGLLSYLVAQFTLAGYDPWRFLLGTVVPHAVLELPALLIISAAALRWHIILVAPPPDQTVSESWIDAGAEFFRILLGIGLPLLLLAALVESLITPQVLLWLYG
jgi:uncharacterized membrane protein SpoIIM required for sporulation/ABC-type transport system involved in multi-copper enzyme maturation permease subunit